MRLSAEVTRATNEGWVAYFVRAAAAFGLDPWVLMAIASRETGMGGRKTATGYQWLTTPGDAGHGFGMMQIDSRSFPEWTRLGHWRDAREGIWKGAEVLAAKRRDIVSREGLSLTVRERSGQTWPFVMPVLRGGALLDCAIAAYNSGDWAPYHVSRGRSPDYGTTGKNYAADVRERAAEFYELFR
ncbi:MAG: hypothetical protein H0W42_02915 [Gemmatimonadaceae bacterium]|nr:hypothetical protein [Gemmatimonadaceae bacterium]